MFPKHKLSSRPSWCIWYMRYARKVYLPLVRDGCWGKDGLWFRTSIPTCSMEFPWSEHKGALGSLMVYSHSFQAGDTPHTQTPNAMSLKILQVGWEHVREIPIQNPLMCWTLFFFFSNNTLDLCVGVWLTSSWYCWTLCSFDNPCKSLGRASRAQILLLLYF